jgi:hypothetical protein
MQNIRYGPTANSLRSATASSALESLSTVRTTSAQGLTLAHLRAQLEHPRDTSLTLELNLSIFGAHPRVNLGYMGDKVSLS